MHDNVHSNHADRFSFTIKKFINFPTWYFLASDKRTSSISRRTGTYWIVVVDMTQSPCSTHPNARIWTFIIDAGKIQGTLRTKCTFWSTVWWFSKVPWLTVTYRTRTNNFAYWIWSTWVWMTASRSRSGFWSRCRYKRKWSKYNTHVPKNGRIEITVCFSKDCLKCQKKYTIGLSK